jgi:hypothetical protein
MERARLGKLTRNQHVLFRLGELTAWGEGAAALARRAAAAASGQLHPNADRRFDAATLAVLARIAARDAALKIAADGLRWTHGAEGLGAAELAAFESAAGIGAIHRVQAGQLADMDRAADALYGR